MGPKFVEIATLVDKLGYEDYPNYTRIKKLFKEVIKSQEQSSRVFQWKRRRV